MKTALYFFLAFIPAIIANAQEGMDKFRWGMVALNAVYQGLIAIKALQSTPPELENAVNNNSNL